MKTASTLLALSFLAAAATPAFATASATLSLVYEGSTTGNDNSSLSQVDLSNPAFETTGWHHYFGIQLTFAPDPSSNEAFRFVTVNMSFANLAAITPTGIVDLTSPKWMPNNPTDPVTHVPVFNISGDAGVNAGDLQGLFIAQTGASTAYATHVGTAGGLLGVPSLLGSFAVEFPAVLTPGSSATLTAAIPSTGVFFSYFTDPSGTFNSIDLNSPPSVFTISTPAYTIFRPFTSAPEPTSLSLLALAALPLLNRRRRTA